MLSSIRSCSLWKCKYRPGSSDRQCGIHLHFAVQHNALTHNLLYGCVFLTVTADSTLIELCALLFYWLLIVRCIQSAILFYQFCLSICPMPVLCQNEWKYRHIFPHSDRGIVLVFRASAPLQNSKENPVTGGVKYKRMGKFDKYCHLFRKRYETGL